MIYCKGREELTVPELYRGKFSLVKAMENVLWKWLVQYKNSLLTFKLPTIHMLNYPYTPNYLHVDSDKKQRSGFIPVYVFEEPLLIGDSTISHGITMVASLLLLYLHLTGVAFFLHIKEFHSFWVGGRCLRKESAQKLRP